ncbi:hypothetical protein ACTXG7_08140 [Mycolicibacterium sp. Dal123E01]|uniref:hypothetical protein n=1 Tax=Mycolicibacterium sp. Dal123E01 TaxID=3457578 RepID=UPI00403EB174
MFDITGLMRPHVIALPLALALHKFAKATAIYTDPSNYSSGTGTKFTLGPIKGVSPVNGFEGAHNTSVGQEDLLVIGAGYDDKLIRSVAESKKSAEQVVLVGLPSLQPHMYQESLLRLHRVSEFINNYSRHAHLFSPASDPFMTAQVVSDYLHKKPNRDSVNVYLCPTGPKTQALGFAWYFLCEAIGEATSIIFPYSNLYSRETSTGVGRVRTFELELECVELSKYAP